jgi:TAP42-like family
VCIRYLGVDYLLADLLLKSYGANRREQLQSAAELLEAFLTRLESYELLSKQNKDLLERYQEDRSSFQLAAAGDPNERRRVKVERWREEKGLKSKLEARLHHIYSRCILLLTQPIVPPLADHTNPPRRRTPSPPLPNRTLPLRQPVLPNPRHDRPGIPDPISSRLPPFALLHHLRRPRKRP